MDQIRDDPATRWWKTPIIVAIGLAFIACLIAHAPWLNGSWYFAWPYRDTTLLGPARWYGATLLPALPIIVAWFVPAIRSRVSAAGVIVLLMVGVFAIKLASVYILTVPMSFAQFAEMVRSPSATSYYVDAAALQDVEHPLSIYPDFLALPGVHLHTRSKPPGPVMYYLAFIRAFGFGDRSATIAGITLAALAACSIPATFALARLITGDRATATIAATLLALCPGYLLHFPPFDPTYPILACGLIGFWYSAVTRRSARFAVAFGLMLGVTTFITYNVLVLGALLAAWTVWQLLVAPDRARAIRRVVTLATYALIACGAFYLVLAVVTGFNPVATFRAAYANQHALLTRHADQRPYPATIWFDLVDFALGFGWVLLLPVILGIGYLWRQRDSERLRFSILAVAFPVFVAVIALLQAETSRVWIFMLPAFVIPAAIEMRRWSVNQRAIAYATMLLIALAIGHNMLFLLP